MSQGVKLRLRLSLNWALRLLRSAASEKLSLQLVETFKSVLGRRAS